MWTQIHAIVYVGINFFFFSKHAQLLNNKFLSFVLSRFLERVRRHDRSHFRTNDDLLHAEEKKEKKGQISLCFLIYYARSRFCISTREFYLNDFGDFSELLKEDDHNRADIGHRSIIYTIYLSFFWVTIFFYGCFF